MKRDAFKTNGSSPPANYAVSAVTFRLARRTRTPAPSSALLRRSPPWLAS